MFTFAYRYKKKISVLIGSYDRDVVDVDFWNITI